MHFHLLTRSLKETFSNNENADATLVSDDNGTINHIGTNFLTEPTITKFDSILDWDNFNHFYNIFHLNWDKNNHFGDMP